MTRKDDEYFLQLAVEEGQKGKRFPFGAVVVKNGKVIGRGFSHTEEAIDPSAHAEITALIQACKTLGSHNIPGTILYASHEPCLMCFCCAAWAEVDRIVFGVPASEQSADMYEFRDVNIFEMAKKLNRPLKVDISSGKNWGQL